MLRPASTLLIAAAFVVLVGVAALVLVPQGSGSLRLVLGVVAAAAMAVMVGANDVANNVGPTVGSRAIPMVAALALAALFDLLGATLAAGDVVRTVSTEVLPHLLPSLVVEVMLAALLAAVAWITFSTVLGAPISTTHAIVGAMLGAALAAQGWDAPNWTLVGAISVSWIISPVLGGVLAALVHSFIRLTVTRRTDKVAAARVWVPVWIGLIAFLFVMFLGSDRGGHVTPWLNLAGTAMLAGFVTAFACFPWVRRKTKRLENRKKQVAKLFRAPLIAAAALLSFAHGTNDVANAVAPLLAIFEGDAPADAGAPLQMLLALGGVGLAVGILLFGPRVIRTVGFELTKLNEIRAFCVALSAAATVLLASNVGLPISSTHVAVGAVFGVGFLREFLAIRNMDRTAVPVSPHFTDRSLLNASPADAIRRGRRVRTRYLVRRFNLLRIVIAWIVTFPASALLGAVFYVLLRLWSL